MNYAFWKTKKGRFEIAGRVMDLRGSIITADLSKACLGWSRMGSDDIFGEPGEGFPPKPFEKGWSKSIRMPVLIDDAELLMFAGGQKLVNMYMNLLGSACDPRIRFRIAAVERSSAMIGGKYFELCEPRPQIVDANGRDISAVRAETLEKGRQRKKTA